MSQQHHSSFHEENICCRALLTIVARGNAIVAELHRLVELVPAPFLICDDTSQNTQHNDSERHIILDNITCDFSYFKNTEAFEARIEATEVLKKADEDFCDKFSEILTRFYLTFDSIQRYSLDLNNFISDLEDEVFVGQSLEGLLLDTESRQLLCEAYFLLGYMLSTTDSSFEGPLRERLIVSYYRYSSYKSAPDSNIDDTCNLMRSTGFKSPHQKRFRNSEASRFHRPREYPESLFDRVGINKSVVNLLIAKIQSLDIYNQTLLAFPHPDHRSVALSQQASVLYILLYFCPNILNTQRSRMREITDKFFYDNWVVSIHMGELVNLLEAWEPYKAARESLVQLLELDSARALTNQYNVKFYRISKQLQEYLREGWLSEPTILENHSKILNVVREANVVLRWMLLHSQMLNEWQLKLTKTIHSIVIDNQPTRQVLYMFLQNLSVLEKKFSSISGSILSQKGAKVNESRNKAVETLVELLDMFQDDKLLRRLQPGSHERMINTLKTLTDSIRSIDFDQTNARDLMINLINELKTIQDTYLDGKNLQVVQYFIETRENLFQVLRFISLNEDTTVILHAITDFSYAWKLIDIVFTTHMQQVIKEDPLKVYGVESTFLKLASSFDAHLLRIHQVNSKEDLISVSQYYSSKLVSYIRDVLQIIPETILELLLRIVSIQTEHVMIDMPSKVSLDKLKEYALPEKRFQMLKLTYEVSHYAESMSMMQDTTIGLIRINSKQLLEDGIRRELVIRMSNSINEILQFSDVTNSNTEAMQNLIRKLTRLESVMNGFKRSFEYIQDYLFIYGLRMWQEELSRIVKFNVELANEALLNEQFLQNGFQLSASSQLSSYQSARAPIPTYSSNALRSSFIVRILNEVLKITDPRQTIYDEQMSAWFEQKPSRDKVADLKVFELIGSSLCVAGLNGVDQLCSTLLMLELQKIDSVLLALGTGKTQQTSSLLDALASVVILKTQASVDSKHAARVYSAALMKLAPHSEGLANHLLRIGQLQAIRTCIGCVLSSKCRHEARHLYGCVEALNASVLMSIKSREHKTSQQMDGRKSEGAELDTTTTVAEPRTGGDNLALDESQLLFELSNHLDWIGLSDPLSKIYTLSLQASSNSASFEFRKQLVALDLLFLVLLEQCSRFHFSRAISGFVPKQSRSFYHASFTIDGQPFFYGLMTLINHYAPFLGTSSGATGAADEQAKSSPLVRLLELMSVFVRCSLDQLPFALKTQNLSLEVVNMVLSMIELTRLARRPMSQLLPETRLPEFIFDTFQFNLCSENGSLIGGNKQ